MNRSGGIQMLRGEISNQLAPTIVMDIDELIVFTEKKLFGLAKKTILNPTAIRICEHHMRMGRMIYLLAHGRTEEEVKEIEEILDSYDFPYTKLFTISDSRERESILGRDFVHFYFYTDKLHSSTDNKRKEKQILNITETYF
jgi:hypothetical protein